MFNPDLVANYFAGVLTERFERQIRRFTGFERVQIDPLLVGASADPTARITLGKEVADDLFIIYSTDLSTTERQLYQIEWQASRKFKLIAERGTTGGIGGDFRYSNHYYLRRPGPQHLEGTAAVSVRPESGTTARIREVALEGAPDSDVEALRERLPLKVGDPFRRGLIFDGKERIRRFYAEQSRLQATVDTETETDDDGVTVKYEIRRGPITRLEIAGVQGKHLRRVRSEILEAWDEPVRGDEPLRDAEDLIRDYFQSRGYFAADVISERVVRGEEEVIRFEVDPGKPVRIERVELEGNTQVPEERIRRQILTRKGNLFSRNRLIPETLDEDLRAIRNLYRDLGYAKIRIAPPKIRLSTKADAATIRLEIDEGPLFPIAAIAVPPGLPIPERRVIAASGLRTGEPYSPATLLQAEARVRTLFDQDGYPSARVRARAQLTEADALVEFVVESGPRVVVGEIEVDGNHITNSRIIRRELDIAPGDVLSRQKLLEAQHRLYGLGIFRNVKIDYEPLTDDSGTYRVRVRVQDAKPLALTVGAGYDTEGALRGLFAVSHDNIGGHDRNLGLQARVSGIEERVQLTARDPRLFDWRVPTIVNLGWSRREEVGFTQETRSAAARLEAALSPKFSSFVRYNLQRIDLLDVEDPLAVREEKLDNIQLGDLSYTLFSDTRDDPFVTTRGEYLSGEVHVFAKGLLSDASFVKAFGEYHSTIPIRPGHSYAVAVRLGLARPFAGSTQVPLSERFFAGGDSTLRGFPRDAVGPRVDEFPTGGEALLLFNQEYRYPIWRQLRGIVFYDAGNIYEELSDLDPTELRHVLGLGLRLETPIGPLRLEYGRKLDRNPGESGGELFLSIGAAF